MVGQRLRKGIAETRRPEEAVGWFTKGIEILNDLESSWESTDESDNVKVTVSRFSGIL